MIREADKSKQFFGVEWILVVRGEEAECLTGPHSCGHPAGLQHHADSGDKQSMIGHRIKTEDLDRSGSRSAIALERLNR